MAPRLRKTRRGKDPAWEHAIEVPNPDKDPKLFNHAKCRYCGKEYSGGITRLKNHWAGTHHGVEPCKEVSAAVREEMRHILGTYQESKQVEQEKLAEMGTSVYFGSMSSRAESNLIGSPSPTSRGPMDRFMGKEAQQTTINHAYKKMERKDVCQAIGRFFYANALPFNLCNSPYFKPMLEAVENFGRGLKAPSYHEMRTTILKEEVDTTHKMLQEFKKAWAKVGCSIMCDGWTDGKKRYLLNFLVNSSSGTMFLKSIDISDMQEKTAVNLEKLFDEVVRQVGKDYVIQFITDNAANYKAIGKLLEKRSDLNLFWTPCTAHCLDLMLKDIGELTIFKDIIEKAKLVSRFLYNHAWVLSLMRKHTKNKEILRPVVTRFGTSYLTLHSLLECKDGLKALFLSPEFRASRYAKLQEGAKASDIITKDDKFWKIVIYTVKATLPLVKVLRLVDADDRPPMGFVYEAMDKAKEAIASNLQMNEKRYKLIWEIIDKRLNDQLHHPLHAAGYFLNPYFHYDDNFNADSEIMNGFYDCVDKLVPDIDTRRKIIQQQDAFNNARGLFGREMAIATRKNKSPADWWNSFGHETPQLKDFAIRVLNLTYSASGCERNWSTFAMVHSKRRNRLQQEKMNALVFVMYNMKLRERHIKRSAHQDPISLDHIDSDDEWIVEREDPTLPSQPNWLNESWLDENFELPLGEPTQVMREGGNQVEGSSRVVAYKRRKVASTSQGKGKGVTEEEEESFDSFEDHLTNEEEDHVECMDESDSSDSFDGHNQDDKEDDLLEDLPDIF